MPRVITERLAFNRGVISKYGLARGDIKRLSLSAETSTDWMPRVLGAMMLRPGLAYLGATKSNAAGRNLPFVFSLSDKAKLELTAAVLRIWISDALMTRSSVSSVTVNGNFGTDVASWTDNDDAGGTSVWVTGGYMGLTGNGTAAAIRDQTVTVAVGDQNVEHALRVVVNRGPVVLRVGTGTTDDSYVGETELDTGAHSLAFTPTGNFNIRFLSRLKRQVLVDSCNVEASGTVELPTSWVAADLDNIRYHQSGDIVFIGCKDYTQRKIERRATRSWSVVQYLSNNGPFRILNTGPITLTPAALSGNTTLTASAAFFKSTHAPSTNNAGSLFRLSSAGQKVTASVTAANQFTSAIKVTGTGSQRPFTVIRSGTWSATVTLQRSLASDAGPWVDVTTYTTNGTVSYDDALSNQTAWYRIGVKTGDYTSGTAALELNYSGGSIDGVCRVTGFTSSTVVNVEVITDFGATDATTDWYEGQWSDKRGWSSAVRLYEGRIWWAGKDRVQGSVSDDYYNFNDNTEGDSAPLNRTIGTGPVDTINWILDLDRMILGAQGAEFSVHSSSLDEPLTPTNFQIKTSSGQGSAGVDATRVDDSGVYVQRGGTRVYELAPSNTSNSYSSNHLTAMAPEICQPRVVRMAHQRQPDTRIHCVLSDGTVAVMVYDRVENVTCWVKVTSTAASGLIEDVCVLPGDSGDEEDAVYYIVRRTVNGATVRYHEKWAMESQCRGGTLNRQADSFVTFTKAPASDTVTGLTHLIAASVVVWADGKCLRDTSGNIATFTVNGSGEIVLTNNGAQYLATTGIVGLTYTAQFKSSKLLWVSQEVAERHLAKAHKNIRGLGLVLADTHHQGVTFGPDFSSLDNLPGREDGSDVATDTIHSAYDEEPIVFPGTWSVDSRLCLQAQAPRPATVLAAVMDMEIA